MQLATGLENGICRLTRVIESACARVVNGLPHAKRALVFVNKRVARTRRNRIGIAVGSLAKLQRITRILTFCWYRVHHLKGDESQNHIILEPRMVDCPWPRLI